MQYHTAFYLTKPKVYCPHIVDSSCMNGIVSSLLTLNGEGVRARILMLILVQLVKFVFAYAIYHFLRRPNR